MAKLYSTLLISLTMAFAAFSQEASYKNPIGLRYIGTIENPRVNPACSYLSRNPMNNQAFLWTPKGSTVMFEDSSTGSPKAWKWSIEGADADRTNLQDLTVTYNTAGTYAFPSQTVTFADGDKTYTPDLKMKVGGVAELCLADTREWINTYALGVQSYGTTERGVLGGANSLGVAGVGNFYMLPGNEIFLDGVNVYLNAKPSKWPAGRKIIVSVYMSSIDPSTGSVTFTAPMQTLESAFIDNSDIKTTDDGVWVPVKNGAVIPVKFQNPVDLYGKPFIFISVSGWGTEYGKEDMAILMDVMPNVVMQPENANNLLAHNSFARLESEEDYLRPVSYYGGNYGSFMICPVIRGYETPSGLGNILVDPENPLRCTVSGSTVTIAGADGTYYICDIAGRIRHSGTIADGSATFDTAGMPGGVYIVRDASGHAVKVKF